MCKRPLQDSGASVKKRHRTSSRTVTDNDSEIIESEESEALPETFGGETKESDSDRRGREQEERKQKKTEEAAERKRQGNAKKSASTTKPCVANIGGKRVKKNGIMTFEGGQTFGPFSRPAAEDATGILKGTINRNICYKTKSRGKKGIFKGQQVMFINAPVDTSMKVPCTNCGKHFCTKSGMTQHVRKFHPEVLPPAPEKIIMPEEFETFMTQKQYGFVVEIVRSNIKGDIKKKDLKPTLMAMIEGVEELPEPLPSNNIKGAANKYHLDEQQIRDSIDNNESLVIGGGLHKLQLGLGKTRQFQLKGLKVTFSWKHRVTEEDKVKLLAMDNKETRHMIARQICVHMNAKGMFASEDVIDDNGGLIKHGFVFEPHGGLFAPSNDRIEDTYTVNGQTFYKLHYPNLENALENINVVALMANVPYKASKVEIQRKVTDFTNRSEQKRQEEFEKVWKFSQRAYHNGKSTPLYEHARTIWRHDKLCQRAFPDTPTEKGYKAYWQHLLGLLKKQEGLCAIAKIPMSLESGPWKMSGDAIDPRKGHVPGNLRLVCLYNNTIDHSKLNKDLTDTNETSPPTSLPPTSKDFNTILHDEYWGIVR